MQSLINSSSSHMQVGQSPALPIKKSFINIFSVSILRHLCGWFDFITQARVMSSCKTLKVILMGIDQTELDRLDPLLKETFKSQSLTSPSISSISTISSFLIAKNYTAFSYDPRAQMILAATTKGQAEIWDVNGKFQRALPEAFNTSMSDVFFDGVKKRAIGVAGAGATIEGRICVWDLSNEKATLLHNFMTPHSKGLSYVYVNSTMEALFCGYFGGGIIQINLNNTDGWLSFKGIHYDRVTWIHEDTVSNRVFSYSENKVLKIWDGQERTCLKTFTEVSHISTDCFDPQTNKLIACSQTNRVMVIDTIGCRVIVATAPSLQSEVLEALHYNAMDQLIFAVFTEIKRGKGQDKHIKIWSLEKFVLIKTVSLSEADRSFDMYPIDFLKYDPASKILMISNQIVHLWNVKTGQYLTSLNHDGSVGEINWDPKQRKIIIRNKCIGFTYSSALTLIDYSQSFRSPPKPRERLHHAGSKRVKEKTEKKA